MKSGDILKEKMKPAIDNDTLIKAYRLMKTAETMAKIYEENRAVTSKYVHATSRGHEAIQIATGLQLTKDDWVAPYYRDDSLLLAIGMTPYELMLQLLAKKDDPFSGGRTYYSHPSLNRPDMPKIPHQSSATGMQAIPTTGVAMGIAYREKTGIPLDWDRPPVVVCSLGDASVTEGEVSEAFHMAALKQLPIIFLVQDNEWDISAHASEIRLQDAYEYAAGFKGLEAVSIDGSRFDVAYLTMQQVIDTVRKERRPFLVHAKVPLLNHHTSGVRKEWYRDDLDKHALRDPIPKMKQLLIKAGVDIGDILEWDKEIESNVRNDYEKALLAPDPSPADVEKFVFAPTPITEEKGERQPKDKEPTVMVDCALFAIRELMEDHPECLLYGQDVGRRLGGVFREAATLAQRFGDERVFNTPIQEAFIVGSTVGMSAVGLKPIVEVQFADYIWPGLNQLFTEVSRSYYLSNGKWPVSMILRVPIGAYGSGGPYHSSSVESVLTNIKGIKIAYPSTGADLKGLMKSAFYDPNPVVMLEHKGLYWSKIKGTEGAKTIEPSRDYILPFGKARKVIEAKKEHIEKGQSALVVTYGRGVYWSLMTGQAKEGQLEIIDLRTLVPLDEEMIFESVKKHNKVMVVTEEPVGNSFARSLAGLIQENCFQWLDAPVMVVGSKNIPAPPLNENLERAYLPNEEKISQKLNELINY